MDDKADQEEEESESDDDEKCNPSWRRFKVFIMQVFAKKRSANCYDDGRRSLSNTIRLHINAKEAKPVDILLQRMFSEEFDIENEDLVCNDWKKFEKFSFIFFDPKFFITIFQHGSITTKKN